MIDDVFQYYAVKVGDRYYLRKGCYGNDDIKDARFYKEYKNAKKAAERVNGRVIRVTIEDLGD